MDVNITPSKLSGEITAPSSKSYAHRLLVSAFLSGKRVFVGCKEISKDVFATANALSAMGAEVSFENGGISIERKSLPTGKVVIDCGESGSTLRFLLPLACALGINAKFTGAGRLLERPITPLTEVLNAHGGKVDGFTVNGKLDFKPYEIDGSLSSQYVTGLVFSLMAMGKENTLTVTGKKVSGGYIDVTLDVLKLFGGDITREGDVIKVGGKTNGKISSVYTEGDWSNAAFTLCAGAIGGDVTVKGLNVNSRQGDREILSVLKDFGAEITVSGDSVRVKKNRLKGVSVDIDKIPDLAQIIAVVAAYAEGESTLYNVDRLRLKESDRIGAIISALSAAGITAEYISGNLRIVGGKPHGGVFDGGNDHRTVMSAAVLATNAERESKIIGAEAHEKSYPSFFKDFTALGGKINVVI